MLYQYDYYTSFEAQNCKVNCLFWVCFGLILESHTFPVILLSAIVYVLNNIEVLHD